MKVINIALRRKDGKVECDTLFSKDFLTKKEAEHISKKYDCDVLVSHVGEVKFDTETTIKRNSFEVLRKEKKNGKRTKTSDGKSGSDTGKQSAVQVAVVPSVNDTK